MVERLHQPLKAPLAARQQRYHWAEYLPVVLLGLRFALKQDLGCLADELVLSTTLQLLGDLLKHPSMLLAPSPHDYVQ